MPTISSNTVGVNIQVKRQIVRLEFKKASLKYILSARKCLTTKTQMG